MRAAWYEKQGSPREVLKVGDLPESTPGPGEVRIRVAASAINPGDVKKRQNAFGYGMPYPRVIPHSDGAGHVDRAGEGGADDWIGRPVWCNGAQSYRPFGTAAEYTVVPVAQTVPLPEGVPLEQGACLGIPGITAHRAVHVAARNARGPRRLTRASLLLGSLVLFSSIGGAQNPQQRFALESITGLRLHNVTAEPATLKGKKGVRVTMSDAAQRELESKSREEQERLAKSGGTVEQLAVIEGSEFDSGVIEAEIAGGPKAGAFSGARGFVGLAFRLQNDMRTYDAFYLRPTNGRADDQVRRNHSAQYISHPEWPWFRLRKETPEKYETYVDLAPDEWTKVKIEVRGAQARLYVHDQRQPTLIVNDLKTGANAKGAVALWLDIGTVAHFRNLTVTREPASRQ